MTTPYNLAYKTRLGEPLTPPELNQILRRILDLDALYAKPPTLSATAKVE